MTLLLDPDLDPDSPSPNEGTWWHSDSPRGSIQPRRVTGETIGLLLGIEPPAGVALRVRFADDTASDTDLGRVLRQPRSEHTQDDVSNLRVLTSREAALFGIQGSGACSQFIVKSHPSHPSAAVLALTPSELGCWTVLCDSRTEGGEARLSR